MRPTVDEIQRAAYDRWERRGWMHGGDRDDWYAAVAEMTFRVNYRTIVEYALDGRGPAVLGDAPVRRCRFCERSARPAAFGAPRPVVPGRDSLLTGEVCDDCQSDWRAALDEVFRGFLARLGRQDSSVAEARGSFSIAVLKAMAASALLIMPGSELRYFSDALEWVTNPDHEADDRLLHGAECRVYRASFLGERPRATLARRLDEEAPIPYMLWFLECDGMMVQVPLPMCVRDEDLDGLAIEHPERIPSAGHGSDFRETRGVRLPLAVSPRRPGRASRLVIAS